MKRNAVKLIAAALAMAMLLPLLAVASFAQEDHYVNEDFESFSAGAKLTREDGFSATPPYNEVMAEGENNYFHIPFMGACETYSTYEGNVDESLIVSNTKIEAENGNFVLEASYRPHWVDVTDTRGYAAAKTDDPTVQCQFLSVTADTAPQDSSLNFKGLYIINLRTGHLSIMGTHTGAAGLVQDEWNTVKLVIDPQNAVYDTYVNGVLYATDGFFGGDDNVDQGLRGVDVPEGKIIIAKCNKNVGAYVKNEDAEEYSYVDVDNVKAYPTEEKLVVRDICNVDFENFNVGKVLAKTDGFSETPVYNEIKSEPDNSYVHIPFLGKCTVSSGSGNEGNPDTSLKMSHPAIPYTDGAFTVEVSYRPHYEDVSSLADYISTHQDPTVQCQFFEVSAEENPNNAGVRFKAMYKINLRTGALLDVGTYTGAAGLVADEWNTVKMVIDAENAVFETYINGELYATDGHFGSDDNVDSGMRKLTLKENSLIVAKCNKNIGAYVNDEDATTYSYIDVDNVSIKLLPEVTVTVDGNTSTVYDGSYISLATEGKRFLYASVTTESGGSYITYDDFILAEEGLVVDTFSIDFSEHSVGLRTGEKTGLRFVFKLGAEDYAALKNSEHIKSIRLGRLIIPYLWCGMSPGSLLPENFNGAQILDFPMQGEHWYDGDSLSGYHLMAASIVDIWEVNYNYQFSGVGYMEITMNDEKETKLVLTTATAKNLTATSIAEESAKALSRGTLDAESAQTVAPYAAAYTADVTAQMKEELEGLNVLAMGDSTFAGDALGWEYQWINWLASELNWNLTNLADGGSSISYREGQTQRSIVNRLFNEAEYKFGASTVTDPINQPWRYSTAGALGKSAEEVDLILLTAGFNDYGGNGLYAEVGDMTLENRDTETFIGAWNVVLDELQRTYVNAKIVIINQWHLDTAYASEARGDTITCYEFTNSIADMYNLYYYNNERIFLLDSGDPNISGCYMMDADFRAQYSRYPYDVFHLNKDGMKIMKEAVLPFLWNYVTRKVKDN
ncbi:MAG: SGNH/GDSL hydrolase family protein [Ruminococcaceae bacterium]|nr:SGNH/GDSL hydrolase family protein [Oscillospiraceae bacterium]